MSLPNDIPVIAYLILGSFLVFCIYSYMRFGKIIDIFIPDSMHEFGNVYTRQIVSDFVKFWSFGKSKNDFSSGIEVEDIDFASIHVDIQFALASQKPLSTIAKDIASLWLANRDCKMGMTYSWVVDFVTTQVMDEMDDFPSIQNFRSRIVAEVAQIACQFDWEPVLKPLRA